ncbi:MAG: LysR substrate-binding domain-containing protein [Rhizobium sp.]
MNEGIGGENEIFRQHPGIDLAIRSGELPDTDMLAARLLGMQAMAVCAAPAYLAAHATPRTMADLSGHRRILYRSGSSFVPWRWSETMTPPASVGSRPLPSTISMLSRWPPGAGQALLTCRSGA